MNKTYVYFLVAGVAIIGAGWWILGQRGDDNADLTASPINSVENLGIESMATSTDNSSVSTSTAEQSVKTFDLSASNYKYSETEIRVKKGDTVRIVLSVEQGFHDFVIDEFEGAKTRQIQAPGSETIEFVADKTGTFEFYCAVGSHRAMGMVGKLIVE